MDGQSHWEETGLSSNCGGAEEGVRGRALGCGSWGKRWTEAGGGGSSSRASLKAEAPGCLWQQRGVLGEAGSPKWAAPPPRHRGRGRLPSCVPPPPAGHSLSRARTSSHGGGGPDLVTVPSSARGALLAGCRDVLSWDPSPWVPTLAPHGSTQDVEQQEKLHGARLSSPLSQSVRA